MPNVLTNDEQSEARIEWLNSWRWLVMIEILVVVSCLQASLELLGVGHGSKV